MYNLKNKTSTVGSILLHTALLLALIGIKSTHIIVPSRDNSIEVGLISSDEIAVNSPKITQEKMSPIVKPQLNNADINLRPDSGTNKSTHINKIIQPIKVIPPKTQTLQQKLQKQKIKTSVTTHSQINDLLNNAVTKTTGKGRTRNVQGGNGTSDTKNLINNYADQVIAKIRPFVILPDNLNRDARVIVQVTLLPNMQVYTANIIASSGNIQYDNSVTQAINRVSVFPDLPQGAQFTDYRVLKLIFKPE